VAGGEDRPRRAAVAKPSATLAAMSLSPAPTSPLAGRHLVLALTGGVAAYKAAELARLLTKAGATVQVVMSEGARRFITEATMQALTNRPVVTSQWDAREPNHMPHINLTRGADAIVVAPASTDFIARLAQGRCDDIVSLTCVARPAERCALLLAPAMNREMWAHPATQRNVAQVVADGAVLLGPGNGDQACGETGDGRMLEPEQLLHAVEAHFVPKALRGRRVLITAGPTFEPIDPVRGLTNLSSGKMGFAIARAAAEAGAQVTLVAGPVHLPTPMGVRRIDVQTARQMLDATVPEAAGHDIFIATAAVADWRADTVAGEKIKKKAGRAVPELPLVENPDILATVAAQAQQPKRANKLYCVGFAAESHDLLRHAREKRERKGIPLIVANVGPATFGRDDNALVLVDAAGETPLPPADKLSLARQLVVEIARRVSVDHA
jgi:phosphopantothenoylcysteine decarboxylase / phosphopantothenate---cysteine ligase